MFMNNAQGREYAVALARRVREQAANSSPELAIEQAYWSALSRAPQSSEAKLAIEFLKQQTQVRQATGEADAELLAFADFCQALISMNEFVYVD
jgi:broad specificity phosphatase PhoE